MTTNNRSFSGPWTNEKHVHFLNSMEASFVHTMLENDGHRLRLDRYLPDTSDSTLDLKTQRRKKHATSSGCFSAVGDNITSRRSELERRTRQQQSCQPYTSSHDQVVPQIGNRRGDKDASDSSDAPAKAN